MWIELKVSGLAVDPKTNMPVVLLKDSEQKYFLPIWIGIFEASAIATELEGIQTHRPMTHDLIRNVLEKLDATLKAIQIYEVKENTFLANLVVVKSGGEEVQVDARPSDAIALALRYKAPILGKEEVLESTARSPQGAKTIQPSKRSAEEWEELLKGLSEDAFGKYKM